MIRKAIKTAWDKAIYKGWDKTYWALDIHQTIIKPNYKYGEIPTEFYPDAKEVLQELSKRSDVCMFLYTCSHPEEIENYFKFFHSHDINFQFANVNPEVVSQGYGCYDKKPYYDVLFEDKCGFDAETDWSEVKRALPTLESLVLPKDTVISIKDGLFVFERQTVEV